MLQLFYKRNGAVSVFLTLAIVPMIVVSSCFIDLARVRLSEAVVESAGDLAMNTNMTYFDSTLNDVYGILASCQDMEEAKQKTKEYFEESLRSQALPESNIDQFIASLNKLFSNDDTEQGITDLLNISLLKDDFSIEEVEGGNLTNPAVVKEEIVNFMKYRSVIDGVTEIIEKIKAAKSATKNVKSDTDMLKKQQKAAESEEKSMDKLKNLYDSAKKYQENVPNADELSAWVKKVNAVKKNYEKWNEEAVTSLLGYEKGKGYENFSSPNIPYTTYNSEKNNYKIYGPKKIQYCIQQFNDAFNDYVEEAYISENSFGNSCEKIKNEIDSQGGSTAEKVRVYMKKYNDIKNTYKSGSYYDKSLKRLINAWNNLEKSYDENKDDEKYDGSVEVELKHYDFKYTISDYYSMQEGYMIEDDSRSLDIWYTQFEAVKEVLWKDFKKKDQGLNSYSKEFSKYSQQIKDNIDDFNKNNGAIAEQAAIFDDNNDIIKRLKEAKKNISEIIKDAKSAKSAVETYEKNMDNWCKSVENNKSGSDCQKSQKQIIDNIKGENAESKKSKEYSTTLYKKVTVDKLKNLIDRCEDIKMSIDSVLKAVDSQKCYKTSIKNITTADKFIDSCLSAAKSYKNDTPIKDGEVKAFAESLFKDSKYGWNGNELSVNVEFNLSKNDSKFEKSGDTVYKILDKHFSSVSSATDEDKEVKKKYDEKYKNKDSDGNSQETEIAKKAKDITSGESEKGEPGEYVVTSENDISTKSDLPSKGGKKEVKPADEEKTDIGAAADRVESEFNFDKVAEGVSEILTGCRDDLFVTDYIMSMFTYDTYTYEKFYDLAKAEGKDLSSYEKVKKMHADAKSGSNDILTKWKSDKTTDYFNKTLTNKMMIDDTTNYAYGNEVEYILYGGSNSTNKAKSWGTIYAIKLCTNSIYAFCNFWTAGKNETASEIETLALSITAASMGVIPVAVSKAVMILALAVAETTYDVICMKAGMPSPLIKSSSTWYCDMEIVDKAVSEVKGSKGTKSEEAKDKLKLELTYSDYLTIFLFLKTLVSPDGVYLRTADVIQANMQLQTGDEGFKLENSKTFFKLDLKYKVPPLMLDLPIVTNSGLDKGNPKDSSEWFTKSYTSIRGYY